jgi:hypothetical protein
MKGDFGIREGDRASTTRDEVQGQFLSQNQARERMASAREGLDAQEN